MITTIKQGDSQEEIKKRLEKIERHRAKEKGFDAFKFCGTIKFKDDGLAIQKKLRDEWK